MKNFQPCNSGMLSALTWQMVFITMMSLKILASIFQEQLHVLAVRKKSVSIWMTTSMTHQLPCIYSDREIATMYMRIMLRFFNQLSQIFNKVEYCSIGSGNHSGDYGWLCDIALSQQLSQIGVSAYVSNNEIDNIWYACE